MVCISVRGERCGRLSVVIGRGAHEEDDPGTWEASLPLDIFRQSNGAPVTNFPGAARVSEVTRGRAGRTLASIGRRRGEPQPRPKRAEESEGRIRATKPGNGRQPDPV